MAKAVKTIEKNGSDFNFDAKKTMAFAKQLSQEEHCVVVYGTLFDLAIFYCYTALSSVPVDDNDTRFMLREVGGFFQNGNVVKPTPGWIRRNDKAEASGWCER